MQNSIAALAPLMSVAIYIVLKSGVAAWRARRDYRQRTAAHTLRQRIAGALRRIL